MALLKDKKSQASGGRAAALVALIMGVVILYVLFLPPAERQQLLYGNQTNVTPSGGVVTTTGNVTLLLEHPGRLDYVAALAYDESIPSFNLYTKTEATTLKAVDSTVVQNGWFTSQSPNVTFTIGDVPNTNNVILSFQSDKNSGTLTITLNGNVIYQKETQESNIIVNIPKEFLQNQNSLVFSVSSVGAAFWSTNTYDISNLKIVGDVTDVSKQRSESKFILTTTETNNLDTSTLRFYLDCTNQLDLNKLEIAINGHEVYSDIPTCGDFINQPFSPNILVSGENTIDFGTNFTKPTTAFYSLDQILVKLTLKQPSYPSYYFDLDQNQFNNVVAGTANVTMNFLFTDSVSQKSADIFVNGILTHVDTRDSSWSKAISNYVRQGTNSIKIVPTITFEIADLQVDYSQSS